MLANRLALIISGTLLGLIGVWIKLIGKNIPIMTINWTRLMLAFLFVLIFIFPFYKKHITKLRDIKGAIITGFLMATAFSLFSAANLFAPSTNVALITSLYAVLTPLFAWFILKEKLSPRHIIAIIIALIGLIIINPLKPEYITGNIISLIHPFIFSIFLVYMRKEEKGHDIAAIFWFFLIASIFLTPFPFIFGIGNIIEYLPYVLALGILSTGLPYILLGYGLEKVPAPQASVIILVTLPLSAILFNYIIFKEIVADTVYIGGSLLLLAGIIVFWKSTHRRYFAHF